MTNKRRKNSIRVLMCIAALALFTALFALFTATPTWSFPTKDEFYKSASIDGNLLKDIWDEVQDPRYM